jgi:hypothetical protein
MKIEKSEPFGLNTGVNPQMWYNEIGRREEALHEFKSGICCLVFYLPLWLNIVTVLSVSLQCGWWW